MNVPPIGHPGYMPRGEVNLVDPDGYHIAIGHWGKEEHQAWEKRIGRES